MGPQAVVTLEVGINPDGTYSFTDVEIPLNRIFIAELTYDVLTSQSGFVVVAEGDTSVLVPTITLFGTTTDTSALVVDEMRLRVTTNCPPGEYGLVVGVLRPDNQTAVPVTARPSAANQGQEDAVLVGTVEVVSA